MILVQRRVVIASLLFILYIKNAILTRVRLCPFAGKPFTHTILSNDSIADNGVLAAAVVTDA